MTERNAIAAACDDPADDLTLEPIAETAKALSVSERTVYNLIYQGKLDSVHIGKSHRITRGSRLRLVRDQLTKKKAAKKKVAKKKLTKNKAANTKLEIQCAERKLQRNRNENRAAD